MVEKDDGNWGVTLFPMTETGVTLMLLNDGLGVPVTGSPLPLSVVWRNLGGDAVVVTTCCTENG